MCDGKRKIYLVGIGMGTERTRTCEAGEILRTCDCVLGAARMLKDLEKDLEKDGRTCISEYRADRIAEYIFSHPECKKTAVALSGDSGFYSAARQLEAELEKKMEQAEEKPEIIRVPGISSVVYLASALHMEWEDIKLVSLHGRQQNFIDAIRRNEKTFMLLGSTKSAEMVAEKLAYYEMKEADIYIGRNLSYPDEEIQKKRADQVVKEDLLGLCCVLVINHKPDRAVSVQIDDEEFIRGKVPMTKEEVRTLCIGKLKLTEDAVFYDIGAGTGSIAVTVALQSEKIRVYAIEKNPEGIGLIRENCKKFRTDGVRIIPGYAPEALEGMEPPTHVFIGGSSGNLKEIITCVKKKNREAKIVLTAISLDTLREVLEAVEEGLLREPEIIQLTAARSKLTGRHHMMTGQNPIYIIAEGEN